MALRALAIGKNCNSSLQRRSTSTQSFITSVQINWPCYKALKLFNTIPTLTRCHVLQGLKPAFVVLSSIIKRPNYKKFLILIHTLVQKHHFIHLIQPAIFIVDISLIEKLEHRQRKSSSTGTIKYRPRYPHYIWYPVVIPPKLKGFSVKAYFSFFC